MDKEKIIQNVTAQIIGEVSSYIQNHMEQKMVCPRIEIYYDFLKEEKIMEQIETIKGDCSWEELESVVPIIRQNIYEYLNNGEYADYVKWSDLEAERFRKQPELDKLSSELEQIKEKQANITLAKKSEANKENYYISKKILEGELYKKTAAIHGNLFAKWDAVIKNYVPVVIAEVKTYLQTCLDKKVPFSYSYIRESINNADNLIDYIEQQGDKNFSEIRVRDAETLTYVVNLYIATYMHEGEYADYVKWSSLETERLRKQPELDKLNDELNEIEEKQRQTEYAQTIASSSIGIK